MSQDPEIRDGNLSCGWVSDTEVRIPQTDKASVRLFSLSIRPSHSFQSEVQRTNPWFEAIGISENINKLLPLARSSMRMRETDCQTDSPLCPSSCPSNLAMSHTTQFRTPQSIRNIESRHSLISLKPICNPGFWQSQISTLLILHMSASEGMTILGSCH